MSHYDLLVAFFTSPSTTLATTSTNKSLWLIGAFFHLSFNHAGHNKSLWLIGCFFLFSFNYAGYNWHQQVFMACWCLFLLFPQPHRLLLAPTSHYDSLMPFFSYPSTMLVTTSTNEPLWLIGAFFCFSLQVDHTGHTKYQWVLMACWLLFSPLPQPSLQFH